MESFDFTSPLPLAAVVATNLAAAVEAAAARTGLLLTSMLRRPSQLTPSAPTRTSVSALARDGQVWFELDLGLMAGRGVIVLPEAAVVQLADVLMGGPGLPTERRPAALERNIVARRLAAGLAPLITGVVPDAPACGLTPCDPNGGRVVSDLVCVTVTFTVGTVESSFELAVPFKAVAADDGVTAEPTVDADPAVVAALRAVAVPVSVHFAPVCISAADLDALAVGDVIRMPHPIAQPLVGRVDGRPYFRARPGRRGRNLAVEIETVVEG